MNGRKGARPCARAGFRVDARATSHKEERGSRSTDGWRVLCSPYQYVIIVSRKVRGRGPLDLVFIAAF